MQIFIIGRSLRKVESSSYKATSTNSSPNCENPMSTAPKNDVGATLRMAVDTGSFTLCFPVKTR